MRGKVNRNTLQDDPEVGISRKGFNSYYCQRVKDAHIK